MLGPVSNKKEAEAEAMEWNGFILGLKSTHPQASHGGSILLVEEDA